MSHIRFLTCIVVVSLIGAAPLLAQASLSVVPAGAKTGTNFPGHDLRSFKSGDVMSCSEVCDRTRGCMAWTWVKPGVQGAQGMCWLKDGAPSVVTDSCCVSGLRRPSGQPEPGVDRPGQDYKSFDMTSTNANLCQQACYDDKVCRAWTYVKPGIQAAAARCWLKKSVPNPVSNTCCTSGATGR